MKIIQIKKVMKKYKKSWENQDSNLILECFTKKGIYQESPLSKPYKGHEEIKKFWENNVKKNTKNIKFKLGKCYVSKDEKTGFAEWECNNEYKIKNEKKWKKDKMVGIMILKMKNNKISYLNEYWNTK
ncbi:MAG: nuclear transport factor 2 family protein [Candidatus Nanoarchaeia archaeon]|jgi:ketosteroid isomerase-like protein